MVTKNLDEHTASIFRFELYSSLKMETTLSSKMLGIYYNTRRHIPEDGSLVTSLVYEIDEPRENESPV
jgi:hypothetical protein